MAKHIPTGPIIAVSLVVAAGAWLLTGTTEGEEAQLPSESAEEHTLVPRVQVKEIESESVRRTIDINGVTKPARTVAIASEATGRVLEVLKAKGDRVASGELIARIDPQDLEARLRQARASVEQTRLEYEGAQRLRSEGLQNRAQAAAALTNYERSRAELEALELALANTRIRAPFDGVIESRSIEIGSYVRTGDPVAELYDYTPLIIEGDVPETEVQPLAVGQNATVELVTGKTMEGTISFIGGVANPATRTFKVEISVAEVDEHLAGATASATVALQPTLAHYISPALLNIDDSGRMGLKTLNSDDQVQFTRVEIVRSDTGGVWVTGLDNPTRLIVVGQGFVNPGDTVTPVPVKEDNNLATGM
ncbi:efflux RND transporter periplasmic adaptor subunit [Saccharospirillum salsuginis]|uniref:Hemolysin D n=1 Tax=Saccharospirillum salsuginis TaxID=418750 RepID=A0A918K7P5_9GAMM|nr:efflux RND transporter periplasmic adaptor subunit [Saccharospirillum salsuginis]GGX53518.1 hemolysin D [Saccharospirillum salsuginis]